MLFVTKLSSHIAHAELTAGCISGVEVIPVSVQVHIAQGLPNFKIVGLADTSILEARERVIASLKSCGIGLPASRITVNLAPAPLKKRGSCFDLVIAVTLLVAMGKLKAEAVRGCLFVGELSLDGSVNKVIGLNAFAEQARRLNKILVGASLQNAAALARCQALEVSHLQDIFELPDRKQDACVPASIDVRTQNSTTPDFSEISGQDNAKRALTIAAAGRHNVLLIGPPGTGKTMLVSAIRSIMPALNYKQMAETALVHSVSTKIVDSECAEIPFRAPHHSSSLIGLIGGGNPAQPGEVSLAHNGILFLDEIAQFNPSALQALRTPLQDGEVNLVRGDYTLKFPSKFQLIAASNPCPCGYYGDREIQCTCTTSEIHRYQNRIGGPLLDRFDLVVWVHRVEVGTLLNKNNSKISSDDFRRQIMDVHVRRMTLGEGRQQSFSKDELLGELADDEAKHTLEQAATRLHLSGRAIVKILRVAQTIGYLESKDKIDSKSILEALGYRVGWHQ